MGQIFALARNCDPTQLSLTGAQGYLLSRIDGATPWRLLREMGGIPAVDVDACLIAWVDEGLLETVGPTSFDTKHETTAADAKNTIGAEEANTTQPDRPDQAAPDDTAQSAGTAQSVAQIDESQLDEDLDLGIGVQRRILEFEASLGSPYHEILSVPQGSSAKVVKRAYFKLSKEFHPDRYFRKEIGSHAARLDRIFKKVLEAHEMLSDPDLCQVENQRDQVAQGPAAAVIPAASTAAAPVVASQPKPLTKLERLKQRMPFKIDEAAIEARRVKAQEIFRAAENSQRAGRLTEAEASIRIAVSFDPARSEFKEALGSIRIQQAGARATKLLASPSERMSDGDLREALQLLEDVLIYRPHDPELNDRAARVCLQLGKLDLAMEYAETIVARTPEVATCHMLLGRIHRDRGDLNAAMSSFETALKLDEGNLDARRALASVRIGARDAAQGGTA